MKLLLVGNFPGDAQESMQRFAAMLEAGMASRGHHVRKVSPKAWLAKLAGRYRYQGLPKYLGYVDKFVLFPARLRRESARSPVDVVHIIDHANAAYGEACRNSKVVATCHDLLQIQAALGKFPEQRPGYLGRRFQSWILSHIASLPLLACVSRQTADDLKRITALPAQRVRVVPNALNFPYSPMSKMDAWRQVRQRWEGQPERLAHLQSQSGGFLLNVGGNQWYKNRSGLLKIYAHLRNKLPTRPALVMVGKALTPTDSALARSLGIGDDVWSYSNVSNETLQALYCTAEGLLFPSWHEGFGWPIAEAQACGCPVFTSNRPPMNDVGGESALYFDPAHPEQAANRILTGWSSRPQRVQLGLHQARRWELDLMLDSYEELYSELACCESSI